MTVHLLFDEFVYLLDDEAGRDVQTLVEKPEIYLFGRSRDTTEDKLCYVDTRVEDIDTLGEPLTINNVNYNVRFRYFGGDHPEQSLEAGQTEGGNYPCVGCSSSAKSFDDIVHVNRSRHRDLQERTKEVSLSLIKFKLTHNVTHKN